MPNGTTIVVGECTVSSRLGEASRACEGWNVLVRPCVWHDENACLVWSRDELFSVRKDEDIGDGKDETAIPVVICCWFSAVV
jgi:hypothetical protein